MSIMRVRTGMTGFNGAPGLMTQYFSPAVAVPNQSLAQLAVDRVRDALLTSPTLFPTALNFAVQGQVDVLEESTGQLVDSINVTGRSVSGSGGATQAPGPAGICITWLTGAFRRGRRVYGRTFLVPVAGNAFEGNGTLTAAAIAQASAIGDAMNNAGATDLVLVVWGRPSPGGSDGTKYGVVGNRVTDQAAVLRSRR